MTRGIDPEFQAEIATRRAAAEAAQESARRAWVEFRVWVLTEWINNKRGSAKEVAAALGISRGRLYQERDKYLASGDIELPDR